MQSPVHVYFGGTFDPPHLGHDQMLQALIKDPLVAQVHIVPTGQNPLKASQSLGTREQRLEWTRVWLDRYDQKKIRLELREIDASEGPQYTVNTLEQLKKEKGGDWILCVGGDIPATFHKWKDCAKLFALLHSVWVFPRSGQQDPLENLAPELRSLCEFRVMLSEVCSVSSTEVRDLMQSGKQEELCRAPLLDEIKESLTKLAGS